MKLLSIGNRVGHGVYALHSRFTRVVNFTRGPRLVCVAGEDTGPGPLNIVVGNFEARAVEDGAVLRVGGDTVWVGDQELRFTEGERYHAELVLGDWDADRFCGNLMTLREALLEHAPAGSLAFLLDETRRENLRPGFAGGVADRIARGVEEVFRGDLLAGVAALKGCGVGLTPSGDDFIAGLLIAFGLRQQMHHEDYRATMEAVFQAARGANVFSNAFLELARTGMLFGRMKELIMALLREPPEAVAACARRLCGLGGTSGADLGTGFFMTIRDAGITRWARPGGVGNEVWVA